MCATQYLAGHGLGNGRVGMTQQQRAVSRDIVDVFIAIHVPLARPLAVGHEQREGCGIAAVVGDTAREDGHALFVPLGRAGMPGNIFLKNRRHSVSCNDGVGGGRAVKISRHCSAEERLALRRNSLLAVLK